MWAYEKILEYPIKITHKDVKFAKFLFSQYGGPDGELSTALRYLNQRYTMPTMQTKALLTDIGTEELAHLEIIATMIYQLLKDATPEELSQAGLGGYYAQHDHAPFYLDSSGVPWTAAYIGTLGEPIADLYDDLAAEQKSRATYQYLINLTDDLDIKDILRFLLEREIVHFQRFKEAIAELQTLKSKQ